MSYSDLGKSIGELVEKKQAAYGDSFGKSGEVMRILYPDGIPPGKLDDALTVIRVLDKLFRIATDRDALGESPWRDVAGYALLSVHRVEATKGYCVHCGVFLSDGHASHFEEGGAACASRMGRLMRESEEQDKRAKVIQGAGAR